MLPIRTGGSGFGRRFRWTNSRHLLSGIINRHFLELAQHEYAVARRYCSEKPWGVDGPAPLASGHPCLVRTLALKNCGLAVDQLDHERRNSTRRYLRHFRRCEGGLARVVQLLWAMDHSNTSGRSEYSSRIAVDLPAVGIVPIVPGAVFVRFAHSYYDSDRDWLVRVVTEELSGGTGNPTDVGCRIHFGDRFPAFEHTSYVSDSGRVPPRTNPSGHQVKPIVPIRVRRCGQQRDLTPIGVSRAARGRWCSWSRRHCRAREASHQRKS